MLQPILNISAWKAAGPSKQSRACDTTLWGHSHGCFHATAVREVLPFNLALLPVTLIQTWLREFLKMFDKQRSPFTMTIKIGWGQAEKNKHLKKYAATYWLLKAYEKCTNIQARRSYLSFIAQYQTSLLTARQIGRTACGH